MVNPCHSIIHLASKQRPSEPSGPTISKSLRFHHIQTDKLTGTDSFLHCVIWRIRERKRIHPAWLFWRNLSSLLLFKATCRQTNECILSFYFFWSTTLGYLGKPAAGASCELTIRMKVEKPSQCSQGLRHRPSLCLKFCPGKRLDVQSESGRLGDNKLYHQYFHKHAKRLLPWKHWMKWWNAFRRGFGSESRSSWPPPIIIEIQHNVNHQSFKRAINYCLQAYKRYKVEPTLLVLCIETLNPEIAQLATANRFPGSFAFPAHLWAANCAIVCKESLAAGCNVDVPLHPLIALGLFSTSRSPSITWCPFTNDLKIQYIYTLAASNKQDQQNNIVLPLLESQDLEYDRLLSTDNTFGSPDVLIQAINDAKARHNELKNKDDSNLASSL